MRHSDTLAKRILLIAVVFVGWAFISLLWSPRTSKWTTIIFLIHAILLFQIIVLGIENRADLYRVLRGFLFFGVLAAIFMLASQWYSGTKTIDIVRDLELSFMLHSDGKRAGGFAFPNIASLTMNMFVFISLALMYGARRFRRIFLAALAMFFVICTLLTASKMGMLTLLAGLFFLLYLSPTFRGVRIRLTVLLLAGISGILPICGGVVLKRFQLLFKKGMGSGSGTRLDLWTTGFREFADTHGMGVGAGGLFEYSGLPSVHSCYLSILFELGIVGVLIAFILAVVLIKYIRKTVGVCKDRETAHVVYCFIALLVTFALYITMDGDYHLIYYWLIPGLAVAVFRVANVAEKASSDSKQPVTD